MKKNSIKYIYLGLLATVGMSAATLDIYQDGAKYRTIPTDKYLGFARGVTAVCEGQDIAVTALGECSQGERLCALRSMLREETLAYNASRYEVETLEKILSLSKPTKVDASKWIEAASKIGKQKATLQAQKQQLGEKMRELKQSHSEVTARLAASEQKLQDLQARNKELESKTGKVQQTSAGRISTLEKELVAAKLALHRDDEHEAEKHQNAGKRRGDAGAGHAECWKAEIAEHQAPVGQHVEGHHDEHDGQRPARTLQRGNEGAQDDVPEKGKGGPLQRAHIAAGDASKRRFLPHP